MVKNYNAIDCMKLVMAILVVAIHTHPLAYFESETLNIYFSLFTSLAVPFFFITSGFFLYNKIVDASREERLARIKKWWLRIAKLYFLWTLIYLPYSIYGLYHQGWRGVKFVLAFCKNVLLVGENFMSWHLWYLLAMLVAGALIYIMEKLKFSYAILFIVAFVLTILGYVLDCLHTQDGMSQWCQVIVENYFKFFQHTRNGFFKGMIYIVMGIGVAKIHLNMSLRRSWFLFILTLFVYLIEKEFTIYFVCLSLFLLVKSLKIDSNLCNFKYVRLMSIIIYFVHMLFVGGILLWNENLNSFLLFGLSLFLSISFSIVALKGRDKKYFKLCFE